MTRLKFDVKSLKSKSNSVQLAKRVQALHEELASFEQETVEQDSLQGVAKELISNSLLLHKDRSVKAFVACCLADILKLLAPDAPYTETELRDVFAFIFRQLKNLGKPNEAHQAQYAYLLDSLANAKSACLICELPGADEQITDAFKDFLTVVGSSDLTANVRGCMTDILCQLLEEAQSIPQDAVDELLRRLLPKNARNKTPSYHLAASVFRHVAERLHRHVSAYFTDVFGQVQESLVEEGDADLEELSTAHELIKELNRVAPQVLLNVIPQLEEQLQSDHLSLRLMATKSLGSMFAEHAGMLDHLAKRYPSAWRSWLGRAKDKDNTVRLVVLESLKPIWAAHPALVQEDLQEVLGNKLLDPDEKVRCAAANVFSKADLELVLRHMDISLLQKLSERIRDKKTSVSTEALRALGRCYNLAFPDIAGGDLVTTEHLGWIPDVIFKSSTMQAAVSNTVEAVVLEFILPLPARAEDAQSWVERFIFVFSSISDGAQTNMLRLTNLAHLGERRPSPFKRYITACEENNGGVIDQDEETKKRHLNAIIEFLGRTFPDPKRAKDDLHKFAKMNENRLYKLLKTLMDPQTDLKNLLKTHAEAVRRIESSAASTLDTFKTFIRRSSLLLINKTAIPLLLSKAADVNALDESARLAGQIAETLLTHMAKKCPTIFKDFEMELSHAVDTESQPRVVQLALLAASELEKVDAHAFDKELDFAGKAQRLALHGSGDQAKFAASFLAAYNPVQAEKVFKNLQDSLPEADGDRLVCHLKAINRLCRDLPQAANSFDKLSEYVMKDLLPSRTVVEPCEAPDEWVSDEELSPCTESLVYGVKILGNLCRSIADQSDATDKADAALDMLWNLLTQTALNFKPADTIRLKLQAALTLLKLAMKETYEVKILEKIRTLALACQDPCFEVRYKLVRKLGAYLSSRRLKHPFFNLMLFICAHDPEPENTDFVKAHVQGLFKSMPPDTRLMSFELLLIRFIHLLAHHPDFGRGTEDLVDSAKYIEFYLDCVATSENISLLHHLTLKIRTVRDAASQGHSENVYTLSEIAQRLVTAFAAKHHWIVQTYPGKIKLPSDIFKPLPSHQLQQDLAKKTWLSSDVLEEILSSTSIGKATGKRKATAVNGDAKPKPKKRRSSPKSDGEKKPRKTGTTKRRRKMSVKDEDAFGSESEEVDSGVDHGEEEDEEARPAPAAKGKKPKPKPRITSKTAAQNGGSARRSRRSTKKVNYASGQESVDEQGQVGQEPEESDISSSEAE